MKRTYQTRFTATTDQAKLLGQSADEYSMIERTLFAETMIKGITPESVKNAYLKRFSITGRQFNAVCRLLKGKVKSIKALRKEHIFDLKTKVKKTASVVNKLEKQFASKKLYNAVKLNAMGFKLHQKKRRHARLLGKLERAQADHKTGKVSLCFGNKKLFKAQHNLEANGYLSHEQWLADWQAKRSSEFFVLGSKDETAGCQGCVMILDASGNASLRLRLPNKLVTSASKYLVIPIELNYGKAAILHALLNNASLCYRFKRDSKGWRVFITVDAPVMAVAISKALGAIGVDINADHLAVVDTDRFGNYVDGLRIPLVTYGKSTEQTKAIIGDAIKRVIDFAAQKQKPLVIEVLDFSKKKAELEAATKDHHSKRYHRMLSSLAYHQIKDVINARDVDNGIDVLEVNPAYTSVIGFWKFSSRYGLSSHQAAALVIARRGLGLSERPNRQDYNASQLPAESYKHVWSYWRKVARKTRKLAVLHSLRNQSSLRALAPVT